MELKKLHGTCSMYELFNVDKCDVLNNSVKFFLKRNYFGKVCIYNTNFGFWLRLKLRFIGFKCIGSYRGRLGKVYIMLLKSKSPFY